jgi:hypothetical protein
VNAQPALKKQNSKQKIYSKSLVAPRFKNDLQDDDTQQCRFCWCQEHDTTNPLIQICHCSGGVKFIHLKCVRKWIKSKVAEKHQVNLIKYKWKAFHCEICLAQFPFQIKTFEGQKYDLFKMNNEPHNCIVLQKLTKVGITIYKMTAN